MYLVVAIRLYLKEDVNEDGTLKAGAEQHVAEAWTGQEAESGDYDETQALDEAREKLGASRGGETSPDDVD